MGTPSQQSRSPAEQPSAKRRDGARENPSQVADPTQIAHILQGLSSSHALVTATVPGSEQFYTSAILRVDAKAAVVLMDELNPSEGHELLLREKTLRVNGRLGGVEVGFRSSVTRVEEAGGIAVYLVPFPKKLYYNQRRQYYRLVVGVAPRVPVRLELSEDLVLQGQVHDISLGGIGARFAAHEDAEFKTRDRLESCIIEFPENEVVKSPVEICFVDPRLTPRQLKLGARFLDLSKGDELLISRFINGLERKRLKIRPKTS